MGGHSHRPGRSAERCEIGPPCRHRAQSRSRPHHARTTERWRSPCRHRRRRHRPPPADALRAPRRHRRQQVGRKGGSPRTEQRTCERIGARYRIHPSIVAPAPSVPGYRCGHARLCRPRGIKQKHSGTERRASALEALRAGYPLLAECRGGWCTTGFDACGPGRPWTVGDRVPGRRMRRRVRRRADRGELPFGRVMSAPQGRATH